MNKLTELKAAHAKMGAEIEKLESEPKGVWKPEEGEAYYWLNGVGDFYRQWVGQSVFIKHYNVYQTAKQAEKASGLTRQSNRIIQACINFDADFVPDWTNAERKYSVGYFVKKWIVTSNTQVCKSVAYVSTKEIAQSICDLFNEEDNA